MQHRLDAAQRALDRRGIAHVGAVERDAGGRGPLLARMHVGAQRIEHADLVAAREQRAQHVLADEPGATGEQDPHRRVTAMRMVSSAANGVPRAR